VLSRAPSLFTTLNSISPFLSSTTAGFSGKGMSRFGAGGATSEGVSLDCLGRFMGEPVSREALALRFAGGSRARLAACLRGMSGDDDGDSGFVLSCSGEVSLGRSALRGSRQGCEGLSGEDAGEVE